MGDGERETWTPHMINRHYMQTIIASSASLPLRAEARLVAPVPLRALVHDLAVGVFSRLPPAAPLWSDRLGISATCSRGRARGRRDLPCSQRDPTRSEPDHRAAELGAKTPFSAPYEPAQHDYGTCEARFCAEFRPALVPPTWRWSSPVLRLPREALDGKTKAPCPKVSNSPTWFKPAMYLSMVLSTLLFGSHVWVPTHRG